MWRLFQISSGYQLQLKVVVYEQCTITAQYNADGTYWNGWNNTSVSPGIYTADVTQSKAVMTTTAKSYNTITITATQDINVYAINSRYHATDASTILPATTFGTQYRIAVGGQPYIDSYYLDPYYPNDGSEHTSTVCVAVAKEDGTTVSIQGGGSVGLNKNQAYHYYSSLGVDASGSVVSSNKPIAFCSGARLALGPGLPYNGYGFCFGNGFTGVQNHTYEQLWSTDKWDTDFYAWKTLTPTVHSYSQCQWGGIVGLIANEGGTTVNISGAINGGSRSYTPERRTKFPCLRYDERAGAYYFRQTRYGIYRFARCGAYLHSAGSTARYQCHPVSFCRARRRFQ
jgi:hypothetical protein